MAYNLQTAQAEHSADISNLWPTNAHQAGLTLRGDALPAATDMTVLPSALVSTIQAHGERAATVEVNPAYSYALEQMSSIQGLLQNLMQEKALLHKENARLNARVLAQKEQIRALEDTQIIKENTDIQESFEATSRQGDDHLFTSERPRVLIPTASIPFSPGGLSAPLPRERSRGAKRRIEHLYLGSPRGTVTGRHCDYEDGQEHRLRRIKREDDRNRS